MTEKQFKYVTYSWDDAVVEKLDAVERLVYRSNMLGADQRITNTGGGNTSSKLMMADPLTGEEVEVLWVKGSGGDLRTSKRPNFASLYQDKLMALQEIYTQRARCDRAEVKGLKTEAGVFVSPSQDGRIPDEKWGFTFDVNVIGSYIVADEANRIWQAQGVKGSLLLTTSVNATVAKKGSLAYDTSKAAANHLVRELAIELAPLVRVNGLAPATVVEGSGMFPRQRVISSLSKYDIPFSEEEETNALRDKLAHFYAQRTLTKSPIRLADQAEVAYLLSSSKFSKTTGQIISVDGGLHEAFLR